MDKRQESGSKKHGIFTLAKAEKIGQSQQTISRLVAADVLERRADQISGRHHPVTTVILFRSELPLLELETEVKKTTYYRWQLLSAEKSWDRLLTPSKEVR